MPALPELQHEQLPGAIDTGGMNEMVDKNPGFYTLISNVARRFLHMLGQHEEADPLFLDRERYVAQATV